MRMPWEDYGNRIDNAIQQRFRKPAKRRCLEIAEEVLDRIKGPGGAPVVTGELRDGYYVRETQYGAAIDNKVSYWRYVEFGTRKHGDAQPHVRPAIEAVLLRHLNAGGLTPRQRAAPKRRR